MSTILPLSLLILALLCFYKLRVDKLKKRTYLIGSFLDSKQQTIYYILYESKHGCFSKAKNLVSKHPFLIPSNISYLLEKKYSDVFEAERALYTFKTEFLSKC